LANECFRRISWHIPFFPHQLQSFDSFSNGGCCAAIQTGLPELGQSDGLIKPGQLAAARHVLKELQRGPGPLFALLNKMNQEKTMNEHEMPENCHADQPGQTAAEVPHAQQLLFADSQDETCSTGDSAVCSQAAEASNSAGHIGSPEAAELDVPPQLNLPVEVLLEVDADEDDEEDQEDHRLVDSSSEGTALATAEATGQTDDAEQSVAARLQALEKSGYEQPTPIQAAIIPEMIAGRDVLAQSQTGSGKTAAFALPILSRLDRVQKKPQVLVLAPTRELAIQVSKSFETYASRTKSFAIATIYGGQSYEPQLRQLKQRPQVVVGTPGRVIDHLERGTLDLSQLQWLVLDEADEMLNMGFLDDVKKVLEHTPAERRIALFSATMPPPIREIADRYLRNPARITIKQKTMTAENIRQRAVVVKPHFKIEVLTRLLEIEETDGVIVFTKTREASVEVAERLVKAGLAAVALNGDMPQKTRERTIEQLKNGKLDILVATDVAARGLDVSRVSHVVNFDLPQDSSSYVHRVGRTGRAGRKGEAFILLAPSQRGKLKSIEKITRQPIELVQPPTAGEISQARIRRFKEQILKTVAEQNLEKVEGLLNELSSESGQSMATIAAAVTQLLQGDRQLFGIREPKAWNEQDRDDRHSGEERGRGRRERDWDREPRDHGRGEGRDEGRFQRRERSFRDRDEQPDERRDRRRDQGERTSFRKSGPPTAGMERYRIEVGHQDGVRPGNIVGAVTNEAGLDGSDIGPITIHDSFSTIDLPVWVAEDICEVLQETWVSGKQLRIRPAGASDEGDSAGGGMPRRGKGRFDKPKFGKRKFQKGGSFSKGKSFKPGKFKRKRDE
jgi:ATP-dependent RNA helicase DeaD